MGYINFISRSEKPVKGLLIKKVPQESTHLRGKGQLAITVRASPPPAAEHIFGVQAAALGEIPPLLQQKNGVNAQIGQG
jgi:hypothetical protein